MPNDLYLFNPENDLAIAFGKAGYTPPPMARAIATDLGLLPLWYADNGSAVLSDEIPDPAFLSMLQCFGIGSQPGLPADVAQGCFTACVPWGWSEYAARRFRSIGIPDRLLPGAERLALLRRLSHRSLTVEVIRRLGERVDYPLPDCPQELFSLEALRSFLSDCPYSVLKSPWSSSGKGLFWGDGVMSQPLERWAAGVLRKQGSVMGECRYDKILDFAMEFASDGAAVRFAGYSLFVTDSRGAYKGNRLASDDMLEQSLCRFVPQSVLTQTRSALEAVFTEWVSPGYSGYFGVDMLIYRDAKGCARLHPCVEVNLRMNMGMVARIFHNRYMRPEDEGGYFVDFFSSPSELLADHRMRLAHAPARIIDGKLTGGYLSLNPIGENSRYRARVEVGTTAF